MYYLITNMTNNQSEWVEAPKLNAALIATENKRRGMGAPRLPDNSKCWHDSFGDVINAGIGLSACIGRRENVIREHAAADIVRKYVPGSPTTPRQG